MGFENRAGIRVKADFHVSVWREGEDEGKARWGQAINLSHSGMAVASDMEVQHGEMFHMEFSVPGRRSPLRLMGHVIGSEPAKPGLKRKYQLRFKFHALGHEEIQLLKHHVACLSDPKRAAVTGWGRARFGSLEAFDAGYVELSAAEYALKLSDKTFLSVKEASYLPKFQALLESRFGGRGPYQFRLNGNRTVNEKAFAQVELNLELFSLELLGAVIWSHTESNGNSECGLRVTAWHRDTAVRLEKNS